MIYVFISYFQNNIRKALKDFFSVFYNVSFENKNWNNFQFISHW